MTSYITGYLTSLHRLIYRPQCREKVVIVVICTEERHAKGYDSHINDGVIVRLVYQLGVVVVS